MPAPEIIKKLVEQFAQNRESYRSGKYNEAQLRQEFLDPFFEALGWDVYNKNGYSLDYREVVIEDSLDIEGASKSPDYAFKIGKERKFYLEAKKPKVDIQYDIHPAYQLRRYAWNAHLPLSILTDFEELAVYNCKNRPNPLDSAATGRELFFKYTDYIDRWDELAAIFSKEAVLKGAFDRYADSSSGKKGTTEVDDAFLEDIEAWRKSLAQNIALRNPQVTDERRLNFAVQMTIDRIIFLRICEDRGIEPDEQLKDLTKAPNIYPRLVELFKRADQKYNSGLFHFATEKGNDSPADTFTPNLVIDDKIFKEIFKGIYYPCEYIFKEIPVEILGQVYEQFLGKVIHLTAGHQARIEEKPEVRKAGGVYYTPRYIVDYIVANTVGKLLEGKTPAEAAALKIVDPACGSGSFLLGAYQYLLDWHEKWYLENDPEKWARTKEPPISQIVGGWRLTTQKKKEILVNNIHGVDIDAQAVEVTKLSLLLKVLEGETGQLNLGFERVLPDLGHNIQCGNSLIGEDYFAGRLVVDDEERRRVNPFDWPTAFPGVFAKGGFDAVIGNPPYGIVFTEQIKPYLESKFSSFIRNNDLYTAFIEDGIRLLNQFGKFGFIIPNTFLLGPYFDILKQKIIDISHPYEIINFGTNEIFKKPNVFTGLLFVNRGQISSEADTKFAVIKDILNFPKDIYFQNISNSVLLTLQWNPDDKFVNKIINSFSSLDDFTVVKDVGLNYWSEGRGKTRGGSIADRTLYEGEKRAQDDKPYIKGRDIERYKIYFNNRWLKHDYEKFLVPKIDTLRFSSEILEQPKIVYRQTSDHIIATFDETGFLTDKTVHSIVIKENYREVLDYRYLLGVLNSKLITYVYKSLSKEEGRVFAQVKIFRVKQLPIVVPDFQNTIISNKHNLIISCVERMLELNKRTPATPQEQLELQRSIAATDRQIDNLIYQLYDLTPEEIAIVESENK